MPRPKGSKNKKSSLTVAQIEADIEKQDAVIAQLRSRAADIEQKLTDKKNELKATNKELRAAEKIKDALAKKREEAVAIEEAKAKKTELENVITKLVDSGKSADDIMAALKQL